MGAVVLAHDRLLDRAVALKRALGRSPDDALRFKREFRAIEGLVHPNLVRLYELETDDDGPFFTMEFIGGTDIVTWCAADPVTRVTSVLPQLLDALDQLHQRAIVHCDLKPSNVLVDALGTVKVLDFGVLAELTSAHEGPGGGTRGYLAPERLRGEAASPATDAYALGCVLVEALTGRPVFEGLPARLRERHLGEIPPRPSARIPGVPAWLDEVCVGLLAKSSSERMTLDEVRRRTPFASGARSTGPSSRRVLGRDALSAQLARHLEAGARPLVLRGPTGVGKTTLLDVLARDAAARGRLVLRGASRATERLPYNALDAAIDDLARELLRRTHSIERRALRVAAEAFPLLDARSRAVGEAREAVRQRLFGWRERPERSSRREVFDAVAALLRTAPTGRGLLLCIDDLQWADADSIALLDHVLEHVDASVQVLLVLRTDVELGPAHEWLERLAHGVAIDVPPLDPESTVELVRHAAARGGTEVDERAIRAAAETCEGRPFLAEVAGRALAHGSGASLDPLLDDVWQADGRVLASLAAADDGWIADPLRAGVLECAPAEVDEALRRLERGGLVRRSGTAPHRTAELYHDGVRAAVLARSSTEEQAALHGRIADALLRDSAVAHRAVRHLDAAGRWDEAAVHARVAAARAEEQRAYGLAADLYAIALRRARGQDASALREARAWALERSSRYAEAAEEWARLAARASPEQQLDLALHVAHALIAAHRTAEGVDRLERALARTRGAVRVRGLRAVLTAGRFVVGPIPRRAPVVTDSAARARAMRDLKIGILLAFLDPLTGLRFLQRARADLARTGARAQVAGCDYTFAILALTGSRRLDRVPLAERYLASARAMAQSLELPPDVRGLDPFVEGLVAKRRGHWREAHRGFERAGAIFRESAGTTELTMVRSWQMMTATHAQDMATCRRHRDWFRRHATDSGGSLLVVHLAVVDGYLQVLEGKFDEARELVERVAASFSTESVYAQRAALMLYRYGASVYLDQRGARAALAEDLRRARPFRFLDTMYAGTYATIAGLVEVNALRRGDREASARRVERFASVVDRSPPLWAGSSERIRGYLADACGRPAEALVHLQRAEEDAARYDRRVDVAIARWQRGRRLGGDEGRALCQEAVTQVEALGVSPRVLDEDAGLR